MTYNDFCNFTSKRDDFIWVHEENMDIGGGVLSISDINKLNDNSNIDKIMISGLRQDTFEYFISKYGNQIKYLIFFKDKLVEDLSILSTLKNVIYIDYFFNQRVTKLWDMSQNNNLIGLSINDFSRLQSLKGIETAPSLKYLHFGNKVWRKSILTDLEPLLMTNLSGFSFTGKSIENNNITILSNIKTLKYFDCPTNLYTTEDIAKLVALSPNLEGFALKPYVKFDKKHISHKDVLICGKRKPFLDSHKDKERIEKYTTKFNALVDHFKQEINNHK